MKYAALLRALNVGGKNTIRMETLRGIFTALGFENVKTYINSGNVIFETVRTSNEKLAAKIAEGIRDSLALEVKTMVRSIPEIEEILAANPFEKEKSEEQDIFIVFLAEMLSSEKEKLLLEQNKPAETFLVHGPNVICLMTHSFQDSLLGKKFIDNKLKTPATARNIRTVKKIAEM